MSTPLPLHLLVDRIMDEVMKFNLWGGGPNNHFYKFIGWPQ